MMGTQPSNRQPALFSYHIDLEPRVGADHLLRQVAAVLDLSFVLPTVRHRYGRSGNVSVDPRVIIKMLLLLFLYDVPSERELMEQIRLRLDFLWFLGFDLDTDIPDHSVLSKARARWGTPVFEKLFVQTVRQCVEAGLVNGRLLHVDSTMVKANAHKDSVVASGPELVGALRRAYQQQAAKLQVLPEPAAQAQALAGKPLPVNGTHISTTDPEAELARSKNGVTELNHKEHRLVDDAQGVITAVAATTANVADGTQLPALYVQHLGTTDLKLAQVTVAGDHHYGTANNYIFCAQEGLRAHLGQVSANLEERGQLPLSQFVYEPAQDRLRCPQGHYLRFHQDRPEEQLKVYLIEDSRACAQCALREQCTQSKRGRSIRRHVQAELVEAARREANSPAARHSRQRRQHVMEGSFADAVNNHGAKKARWRGLWRQRIQSWMIAAVQNLRIFLRHQVRGPVGAAVAALASAAEGARIIGIADRIGWFRAFWGWTLAFVPP
jgi:transposase